MKTKLTIEQAMRAVSFLPRGWTIERRENMLDGDGNVESWATKAFYVLDVRTDTIGKGDTELEAIADTGLIKFEALRAYVMRREYTQEQIHKLAGTALNVMCKFVQDEIGQTDGGIAGVFWDNARMTQIIVDYVTTELNNLHIEE